VCVQDNKIIINQAFFCPFLCIHTLYYAFNTRTGFWGFGVLGFWKVVGLVGCPVGCLVGCFGGCSDKLVSR
jgi:hypothetical protein